MGCACRLVGLLFLYFSFNLLIVLYALTFWFLVLLIWCDRSLFGLLLNFAV